MARERLSVLHVHGKYFRSGGAETYLRSLAAAQRARGHRVGILYSSDPPSGEVTSQDEFFCPPSYGIRSGLRVRRTVLDQIRTWHPDLVHLHVTQYWMSPLLVRDLSNLLPTVHTVHDTLFLCFKGIGGMDLLQSPRILPNTTPCLRKVGWGCLRTGCVSQLASLDGWSRTLHGMLEVIYRAGAYRRVHRLLVNSEFTRRELLRNGFSDERVSVVGIGTELPLEWKGAATGASTDNEPPLILFVGKLVPAKGIHLLLDALQRLAHRSWQAVLVGDGPEIPAIQEFITRNGWEKRIRIEPSVGREQLGHFYRRARLVVFPSLWPESWGLVGIEAMRLGRPVVAFDSGAVSEWLENGTTGYMVPWGDVNELSACMERLLLDPDLAQSMGQKASQRAERFFQMDSHVDRVIEIYRDVLFARPGGPARPGDGRSTHG